MPRPNENELFSLVPLESRDDSPGLTHYHQVFMTGYQPKACDSERLAKGDVITDEDSGSDYVDADEDEIVTQGQALISGILEYAPMEDVQKLLDEDAPLWYQDKDGWSALHAAASVEDPELVKKLLQHGALWNSGKSPLSPVLPGRTNH